MSVRSAARCAWTWVVLAVEVLWFFALLCRLLIWAAYKDATAAFLEIIGLQERAAHVRVEADRAFNELLNLPEVGGGGL